MGIDDSSLTPGGATDPFSVGQKAEAVADLGDPKKSDGTPNWDDSFLRDIHGVIIITAESDETTREKKKEFNKIFSSTESMKEIISIYGNRRLGEGNLSKEQSVFIFAFDVKL